MHNIEEFDSAKNRLVVVEFANKNGDESSKIYPFMVELSCSCGDVDFLLVMKDESDKTRELCRREVESFFWVVEGRGVEEDEDGRR